MKIRVARIPSGAKPWPRDPRYRVTRCGLVYSTCLHNKAADWSKAQRTTPDGYRRVKVLGQWTSVHILVAETFIGPKPTKKHQINHKDGKKTNNCASNLEWVTQQENLYHAMRTGLHANPEKAVVGTNVKTGKRIYFRSESEAGRAGFTQANVSQCLRGVRALCKGHRWEYA